jgi:hypothetical protein
MQALKVAALALPIADRIVHEFQLRHFAEILDRKHGSEHRLVRPRGARSAANPSVSVGTTYLDFNQVGNLNRALNFREIQTLPFPDVLIGVRHA